MASHSSPGLPASQADTEALAFIRQSLEDVLREFPQEVQSSLDAKFRAEYASPMTRELELVLHKRLTDDEVHHMMFRPTPQQYRYYATLLSLRPVEAERSSSRNGIPVASEWPQTLQKRFMTLFYLKHARNWALVVEFLLLGGLQVLANQFLHPDLQLRGQAIDCFVQITSSAAFDWFHDPVGYESRLLHSKMVALAAPPSRFLQSLVRNIQLYDPKSTAAASDDGANEDGSGTKSSNRLPGGTYVMLQILAFFLSWVRKFHAQPKNELRLSRELLDLLRDWRERTQTEEQAELELAKQVYDDFSRWPAVEGSEEVGDQFHCDVISATSAGGEPGSSSAGGNLGKTSESFFSRERVEKLLDQADASTRDEMENQAIKVCAEAVSANVCLLDAHSLRAQALVQRIERKASSSKASSARNAASYDDAQRLLDDCAAVLKLDPTNVDARKHQLRVFAAMGMWSEAQEMLAEWVSTSEDALERAFLPGDIAFFKAQHTFVSEKSRAKALEEARQQRLHATKLAKQEEIFQAILQRDSVGRSSQHAKLSDAFTPTPDAVTPTALDTTELASSSSRGSVVADLDGIVLGESTSSLLLSKLASSKSCKTKAKAKRTATAKRTKDLQTEQMCRSQAFVRKLRKVKADPAALTELLVSTSPAALSEAFESALGEEHFLTVFDALTRAKAADGDKFAATKTAGVLRMVLSSARFQFIVEMAPAIVRDRVRTCADETSGSLVAAGNSNHEHEHEHELAMDATDATDAGSATGSACA